MMSDCVGGESGRMIAPASSRQRRDHEVDGDETPVGDAYFDIVAHHLAEGCARHRLAKLRLNLG